MTPADNIMNIYREFQKEGPTDWKKIGKNVLGSAVDVGFMALPAARGATLAARAGNVGKAFGVNAAFNTGLNALGGQAPAVQASGAAQGQASVKPQPITVQGSWSGVPTAGLPTPTSDGRNNAFVRDGKLYVFNKSTSKWQPNEWTDNKTGFVYRYNNKTGLNEVVRTVSPGEAAAAAAGAGTSKPAAPPKELLALQAALQQQFDAARISEQSKAESALNQLSRARTTGSIANQQDLRRVGMAGRGQQLDLRAFLGESGAGISPAISDVSQQYIQEQEAAARSGLADQWAQQTSQIAEQEMATKDALRQALSMLRQQELTARAQASLAAMQNLYGGV
jgi:hypothetical protein